jgi:hypothetical protein
MFEGIRTPNELRSYGGHLRELSRKNFGVAGTEFLRRLAKAIAAGHDLMQAFVDERQRAYWEAATGIKSLGDRDLTRIGDKFATLYIAGCLAIRFKILPFTEAEILEALLTCERDHVAFVDGELGHVSPRAISTHRAPTPIVVPSGSPFDRLQRYVNRNRQRPYSKHSIWRGFIDSRCSRLSFKQRLWRLKGAPVLGYIANGEYWIPDGRFEKIAGGADEAAALKLKKKLFDLGLLETDKRGKRVSYVVKRPLPDGRRQYFVVIRDKPKRP